MDIVMKTHSNGPSSSLPFTHNNAAGRLHTPVLHIGPQLDPSDTTPSNRLEGRPVLRGDERFIAQPLRNGLLADRGAVHKLGDALRQSGLAASDLDRPLKSSNVRFIHDRRPYTTSVVQVNHNRRVPENKGGCTVLYMPVKQRKLVVREPKPEGTAERGIDGRTLGERLELCMKARSRKLGREYLQKDLLADANKAAGRGENAEPVITQQGLSLILRNKRSESAATPAFAVALEVEALWLQYGVGQASYLGALLAK